MWLYVTFCPKALMLNKRRIMILSCFILMVA
jgi:hypothetical protein